MIIGNSNNNKNKAVNINFNIKQHNTFIHEFELYYTDLYNQLQPYDFTNGKLQFVIKNRLNTFNKVFGTISTIDNIARIYIDAKELNFSGKYLYELIFIDEHNVSTTLVEGNMIIEPSLSPIVESIISKFNLLINSVYNIIAIVLYNYKFELKVKSSYNILESLINKLYLNIKSNYLINTVNYVFKQFQLSIKSNYLINAINYINKQIQLRINSNYNITSNLTINNILGIQTRYTIS